MYLKCHTRRKDGKEHRYWSLMEKRRVAGGRLLDRPLLYLGEITDAQQAAWTRSIAAFDSVTQLAQTLALFPADRPLPEQAADYGVQVRLSELRLLPPRQWGACWLALQLWDRLQLGEFWRPRLPASREGTAWYHLLQVLTVYRLIDPGSEWRLHRDWFLGTAPSDLLDKDFARVAKDNT